MKERLYSIKDLETISGIKAHTIRIWEKRYNLLDPSRTDTNIRYYSDSELRKLLNISFLVKHGFRISKVSKWDEQTLSDTIISLENGHTDVHDFLERMTFHLINFDAPAFTRTTEEVISKFGFDDAVHTVFFPFFEKVGLYWQVGSIFPAQEHFISNLFRQKLIVEIDRLGLAEPNSDIIVMYLHENEMHELSLLYYSYLARKRGLQVYYLGQNIPLEDLRRLGKIDKVKYVFTAFINSIEKEALEQYLIDMDEIFGHCKIIITGLQLKIHQPAIPENIFVVESYRDFNAAV